MAEFDGTLITLEDEDGSVQEYELIDTLEYKDESYVALIPSFEDGQELLDADGELVVLKAIYDENGETMYVTIDDDEEFDIIVKEFEKRFEQGDDFEIVQ